MEHYGVLLNESVIRRVTLAHGRALFESDERQEAWPVEPGAERIIAEMDGGRVPIMEPEASQADRRKGKRLRWKEARIAMAHPQGSQTLGSVDNQASDKCRLSFQAKNPFALNRLRRDCSLSSIYGHILTFG